MSAHGPTLQEGFRFLFLNFQGRVRRKWYWIGSLLPLLLLASFTFLLWVWAGAHPEGARFGPVIAVPVIVVFAATLFMSIAVGVKRLHDRNKSGWWLLLFIWVPGVLDKLSDRTPEDTLLWWFAISTSLMLSLWGLIEMGFLKGTQGSNQYGADPLARN